MIPHTNSRSPADRERVPPPYLSRGLPEPSMPLSSPTSELLPLIPLSARTILDVRCADGTLAAAYRPMNPKARLLGIDRDPVAATLAARHLDEVATIDLADDPLPFELPDGIDCIIYDGVLEHLRDPWAVLHRHAEALSRGGIMLIRVPNIDYWRVTERLLRGTGCDGDMGDWGQAQFSLASMREDFARVGLTVCDVATREPDVDAAARFVAALAVGLEALGIDPREYARRASASHLIWRVSKEPRERMILCGSMLDPVGGVSHIRVVYPLRAIGTDPMVAAYVTDRVANEPPTDDVPRIFVLHRPTLFGAEGHEVLRRLVDAGYLVVTEFDDLPGHFKMMQLGGELTFYGVHAVQTSTLTMAEELRRYNSEIAVFPNAVTTLPKIRNFADMKVMTLFFGALNREQDWLPFMPAINAVAGMAGGRLKFEVVHDRSFFDALETPYKAFTPTCDYETYMRLLGGCEISFMPLSNTPFNRAKSDLKFIEASACRVATLAGSVVYGDSVQDERTGLLFRDPVEFHARLLRLVTLPELGRDLANAARRYVVEERMLAYQVSPRLAWYRSLWARRAMLTDARRERMARWRAAA